MTDRASGECIAVDTGVWVDGLLHGGSAEELIKLAITGRVSLLTSESLIAELAATLRRGLDYSEAAVDHVCRFVRDCSTLIEDDAAEPAGRRDAILRTAHAGGASYIATTEGSRLRRMESYEGIPIVSLA